MRLRFPLPLLFFVVFLIRAAVGQSPNGTISGLVLDPSGRAIAGAELLLVNDVTGIRYPGATNGEGIYAVPNLPPGPYRVQVSKVGFKTLIKPDITLNVQDALAVNFTLPIGAISEILTVEGGTPLVATESATVGTVVDRRFVENLPLNGRSFQTLIMLTPGVTVTPATPGNEGQFSVNGQRTDSNYFTVDGVSADVGMSGGSGLPQVAGGSLPGLSAQGGTNSLVSVDAMQEFRVQTSSFSPEFGRSPGGQVSIVTRSGTNQFHATVFDYFRNDLLDANDWFSNHNGLPKPEERQNDFGGVIGGPILEDKAFFFLSYEGLRLRQPLTSQTIVPDEASRQAAPAAVQPYLMAFPVPNGSNLAGGLAGFNSSYSNPATLDAYSIRVDQKASSKLDIFGRYNYSPSETAQRGSVLSSVNRGTFSMHTLTVGLTASVSQQVSEELRTNYSNERVANFNYLDGFGGATPLSGSGLFPSGLSTSNSLFDVIIFGAGTSSSGVADLATGKNTINEQRQFNVVDNVSVNVGAHRLRFGVDYRWLSPIASNPEYQQFLAFLGVDGSDGYATSGVALEAQMRAFQPVALLMHNISFYGQDAWKVGRRLTLTYGLRWDINPALRGKHFEDQPFRVTNFNDPANLGLAPRGEPLYDTTYGNVAPRLGLAYQLTDKQGWETVLRGGIGTFYDAGSGFLGTATFGFPFQAVSTLFFVPLPLSAQQAAPPPLSESLPAGANIYAADPKLRLPRTYQWNVAVEQGLGPNQVVSATYVGAAGRDLLRTDTLTAPNPDFLGVIVTRNTATSDYNALQLKYQRRLFHGLQALASYTLSHSIDISSNDGNTNSTPTLIANPNIDRGNSDFDVRHSVTAALSYDVPSPNVKLGRAIFEGWSIDNFVLARSAPPVDLIGNFSFEEGTEFIARPDVVSGQPLYLYGPSYPGGKAFNPQAFAVPASGQGDLGRNALRGFGAWQNDFTLRRQFPIAERIALQFRAEFFNVFNHPNFGPPGNSLGSPLFGVSTQTLASSLGQGGLRGGFSPLYQIGGSRSIQLALKLLF